MSNTNYEQDRYENESGGYWEDAPDQEWQRGRDRDSNWERGARRQERPERDAGGYQRGGWSRGSAPTGSRGDYSAEDYGGTRGEWGSRGYPSERYGRMPHWGNQRDAYAGQRGQADYRGYQTYQNYPGYQSGTQRQWGDQGQYQPGESGGWQGQSQGRTVGNYERQGSGTPRYEEMHGPRGVAGWEGGGFQEGWRVPGPYTGRGPRNYQRPDERMREDIIDRMTQHGQLDASDIDIAVANGEVTLTGSVNTRSEKHIAEEIAESVSGVRDVTNQLKVRQGVLGQIRDALSPGSGQNEARQDASRQ